MYSNKWMKTHRIILDSSMPLHSDNYVSDCKKPKWLKCVDLIFVFICFIIDVVGIYCIINDINPFLFLEN